jgi:hypothetical protein
MAGWWGGVCGYATIEIVVTTPVGVDVATETSDDTIFMTCYCF